MKVDKRVMMLAETIHPLVERDGKLFHIQFSLYQIHEAFAWSPEILHEATYLEPICEVRTLHSFGAPEFFKPSVHEVLDQMPKQIEDEAVAFVARGPKDADDLNREIGALNKGFHVAKTTFFRRKSA